MKIIAAVGIIIKNRAVLMVRPKGKDFYHSPGGKPEPGESLEQALCRELKEELCIDVTPKNINLFDVYLAPAQSQPDKKVELHTYLVQKYSGEISVDNEVEELGWFNTRNPEPNARQSIFAAHVIPKLAEQGLID